MYLIRAVLFRKNDQYKYYSVNTVCQQHCHKLPSDKKAHVLQAAKEFEDKFVYSTTDQGPRKSVSFSCSSPDLDGTLEENVQLKFMCCASCVTSDQENFVARESSHDLKVVLTLEAVSLTDEFFCENYSKKKYQCLAQGVHKQKRFKQKPENDAKRWSCFEKEERIGAERDDGIFWQKIHQRS